MTLSDKSSTNHLDQLDPGIAKRPSRFDRKYEFPKPNFEERVLYCEYWRKKLSNNKDIEFPKRLSEAIAKETNDFSFAYMQEAFVASLLIIASEDEDGGKTVKGSKRMEARAELWEKCRSTLEMEAWARETAGLDKIELWRVIKKQIRILRDEL